MIEGESVTAKFSAGTIKKVELYPGVEEAASGASLERKSRSWTWTVMSLSC